MALFNWQNGNKVQSAVVTGDGVTVQDAVWEGETPISASNLNSAQTQLVNHVENEINTNLGTETDTWSSSSSYSIGARVKYAGGVYENLTGSNSSAPNIDTTNWKLIPIIDEDGHINEKDIYSTTQEVKTNKTYNGKPVYRSKVKVTLPSFPTSFASKQIAHGIANIDEVFMSYDWKVTVISDGSLAGYLPFLHMSGKGTNLYVVDETYIWIRSTDSWNANTYNLEGYVEYTKND